MSYALAWDRPTRWFHWINVLLIGIVALSGFFFMYRGAFRVEGREAKMALKAAHSWVGYAFALNLAVRIVWGFLGNADARWRRVLPDRESFRAIPAELRELRDGRPVSHLIRSPVSRLSATIMFSLMILLAGTGFVRSATDLYHLPFGPAVAAFIAKPGEDPSRITWRNEQELSQPYRLEYVARAKAVAGPLHEYGSWLMLGIMLLHVTGVVLTEVRQRSGLVSALVSGWVGDTDGPSDGNTT